MSVPYFYVYKDAKKEWRWRFVATNSKTIADSGEGYANLQDCEHGITLLKKEVPGAVTIGDENYKKNRP